MKQYIIFLLCIIIFMAGCGKTEEHASRIYGKDITDSSSQSSGTSISADQYTGLSSLHAIRSGNTIIVNGLFSFSLPQGITGEFFLSQGHIGFINTDDDKSFSIYIGQLTGSDMDILPKDICHVEYLDGFLSKSEQIKVIDRQPIYIHYAILRATGLDVEPKNIIDNQICFVRSTTIYRFLTTNYSHTTITNLVDSIKFL